MSSEPPNPRDGVPPSLRSPPQVESSFRPLQAVPADALSVSPPAAASRPGRSWLQRILTVVRWVAAVVVTWLVVVLLAMLLYTRLDPPFSMLTLAATVSGGKVQQRWVPLALIAPALQKAVIVSEDAGFCRHPGISLSELEEAIERSRGGTPRGASTISMQLTKNLFLWPQRSYLRKAIEIPLTLVMERVLSKHRILEIYLNVAEWGPGIYGIEAAARHHFRKSAAQLSEAESALLAVTLPAPALRNPAKPSAHVQRLARVSGARARANTKAAGCVS